MLKSEKVGKEIPLPGRGKEGRPIEILLATMCVFAQQGREEVSISEFQESISEFQKEFSLGYEFFESFLSSLDLFADLESLGEEGYIRRYTYRHDTLLPKNFVRLMPLGKWHAKKIIRRLSPDMIEALKKAVVNAISNYKETWGSWAR